MIDCLEFIEKSKNPLSDDDISDAKEKKLINCHLPDDIAGSPRTPLHAAVTANCLDNIKKLFSNYV